MGLIRRFAKRVLLNRDESSYAYSESRCYLIFGCQRSGTSITHEVLGKSDHIQIYKELHPAAHHSPYEQDSVYKRFRSQREISKLLFSSPREVVVFKPINETQYAEKLLDRHSAKGIWIYRNYLDVAHSAVKMFGSKFKDFVDLIAADDWGDLGWMTERMSRETILVLKSFGGSGLSDYEGACLFWWTRNLLFLEHQFYRDPRFMLLKYEDMVSRPEAEFARVFRFLELPFDPGCVSDVHASSVGKHAPQSVREDIHQLCQQCLQALDAHLEAERSVEAGTSVESVKPVEAGTSVEAGEPMLQAGPG